MQTFLKYHFKKIKLK